MPLVATLKRWARSLKGQTLLLARAARHPRTPLAARLLTVAAVAYALSPLDLIPDVIPVLCLLDDLILIPACLWLALRLIPDEVIRECMSAPPTAPSWGRWAAVLVICLWLLSAALLLHVIASHTGL